MTIKEINHELFIKVSIAAIQKGLFAEMDGNTFKTLVAIASFQDENGVCFPSQEKIAEICGVKRETINRQIKKLLEFRTKEGHAVIEKTTIRQGREKTRTYYRILEPAEITFGKNKVVTKSSQPIESELMKNVRHVAQCEENSKVVTKSSQGVVTNHTEGCDRNVTLTRTINKNHSNDIQNRIISNISFVENKTENNLLNNNKDYEDKIETNKTNNSNAKFGDNTAISPNIVVKEKIKDSEIDDNKTKGQGTAGARLPQKPKEKPSLSLSDIAMELSERYHQIAEKEKTERKTRAAEKNNSKTPNSPLIGRSIGEHEKPLKSQNKAFDDLSFEAILAMSEEEISKMMKQ